MKTKILILGAFFYSLIAFGQKNYYEMPNGKIVDSLTYQQIKENLAKHGKVEEVIFSKVKRNDSIINTSRLTVQTPDGNGNFFDPYATAKKLIGRHFPIEIFENEKGKNYKSKFLVNKPTFITFWFTNCPPCVEEIPILNDLKKDFADKANFLAITFDSPEKVREFLKKRDFTYDQIVNAKKQIDQLKISAYPTNLILNKEGVVVDVFGEISDSEDTITNELNKLLL